MKLLVTITLSCFLFVSKVVAMEEVKVIFLVENKQMALPLRYAKLTNVLGNAEVTLDFDANCPIPLDNVTLADWEFISSQLGTVYDIITLSPKRSALQQQLVDSCKELSCKQLVSIYRACDYLDIPIISEASMEALKTANLQGMTFQDLLDFPQDVRSSLLLHQTISLAGPLNPLLPQFEEATSSEVLTMHSCVKSHDTLLVGGSDGMLDHYEGSLQNLRTIDRLENEDTHIQMLKRVILVESAVTQLCEATEDIVYIGYASGAICGWNKKIDEYWEVPGHRGKIILLCLASSGCMVSGSQDGTFQVFDIAGNVKKSFSCTTDLPPVHCACLLDNDVLVTAHKEGITAKTDLEGVRIGDLYLLGHFRILCALPNGCFVGVTDIDELYFIDSENKCSNMCHVYKDDYGLEVTTPHFIKEAERNNKKITTICRTADDMIVCGARDHTICVLESTGLKLARFSQHRKFVSLCCTSGGKIISADPDNSIYVWDVAEISAIKKADDEKAKRLFNFLQQRSKPKSRDDNYKIWREVRTLFEIDKEIVEREREEELFVERMIKTEKVCNVVLPTFVLTGICIMYGKIPAAGIFLVGLAERYKLPVPVIFLIAMIAFTFHVQLK